MGRFYSLDENENVITSAKIIVLESQWSDESDEGAWADMNKNIIDRDDNPPVWQSPATMPQSAARTKFKVVGVEVVRVRDLTVEQVCNAGKEYIPLHYSVTVQTYIVDKFGQQAWDNNEFIWYFKIEKLC
jgi:hypothetical protein